MPRSVPLRLQAHHRTVVEHVVLVVDQAQLSEISDNLGDAGEGFTGVDCAMRASVVRGSAEF